MRQHLNTLFVTLEGAWLRKDGAAVEVRHEGETRLRVPLHNLDGILCLGWDISASAHLMAGCAEAGVTLSFCNPHGHFLAAAIGFTSGNVLLRREQYRRADDPASTLAIARNCIAAKIANARTSLLRAQRDRPAAPGNAALQQASEELARRLRTAQASNDLDGLRGIEGSAAVSYFAAFPHLLTTNHPDLVMRGRSRRPPLDPINALLSFLYSLLAHDCRSALEATGLDAAVGFLHRDRPGRPSLALDLMEEFRPFLADRLALSLFNRQQITARDFECKENGAILLREDSRKRVLVAWQERKKEEITHPFLQEKVAVGLLVHLQARLLARHLRNDLDAYPAFVWR
ncbi:subtype I-C CRISPR-associated endonuclease Cas1 [Thiocystis minor]|uniref:type I-C CRISPR-associated endonuclease Cas1c n=1 Tax=Thiocystis minor TaxID=61597 RepID=UPI001913804D|nr:type I-C CRISPR-associated endonuclease Cas1c [Thiocystis minor]MBK5966432.1 subtype I-C CRISPR-associated endonuclease Cas1 [Thiocystis minor]